jgi:hypothetical protein
VAGRSLWDSHASLRVSGCLLVALINVKLVAGRLTSFGEKLIQINIMFHSIPDPVMLGVQSICMSSAADNKL